METLMDAERLREFAVMVENLGNPNDIAREKHTAELEKTLQTNPTESLILCIGLLFGIFVSQKALTMRLSRKLLL